MRLPSLLSITVIFFAVFSIHVEASPSCPALTQCDNCSTDAHWESSASAAAPNDSPSGSLNVTQCEVNIVSMLTGELRTYLVVRHHEPEGIYESVYPRSTDQEVQDAFDEFFLSFADFQSTEQVVVIDETIGDPPGSAYLIPGNSFYQSAVDDYIVSNHAVTNFLFGAAAGMFSLFDAGSSSNFGDLLSIRVEFPDGSSGVFQITVGGIGLAKWAPVPGTFYDADGNEIYFSPSEYENKSGFISTNETLNHFVDRLASTGWMVTGHSSGSLNCSWTCATDNTCTLECAIH